jgi:hypothetical protein
MSPSPQLSRPFVNQVFLQQTWIQSYHSRRELLLEHPRVRSIVLCKSQSTSMRPLIGTIKSLAEKSPSMRQRMLAPRSRVLLLGTATLITASLFWQLTKSQNITLANGCSQQSLLAWIDVQESTIIEAVMQRLPPGPRVGQVVSTACIAPRTHWHASPRITTIENQCTRLSKT